MRLSSFKGITIQAISTYEYSRFTSSCMIYKNLTLFKNCTQDLSMWVWWKYAHKHCKEVHKIKCMFRLLIGQNCLRSSVSCFDKTSPLCINCTDRHIESVEHVLFQCTYFEYIRKPLWAKILRCCSVTLRTEIINMNTNERTIFFLSGMRTYVPEWDDVYTSILNYCYSIYVARREMGEMILQ